MITTIVKYIDKALFIKGNSTGRTRSHRVRNAQNFIVGQKCIVVFCSNCQLSTLQEKECCGDQRCVVLFV